MIKHLAIKYKEVGTNFNTYPESIKTKYFDTKESAKSFVKKKKENEKLKNRPKTYWEYRGLTCTYEVEE